VRPLLPLVFALSLTALGLAHGQSVADCVSGQLPRVCSVARAIGTVHVDVDGVGGGPTLPALFGSSGEPLTTPALGVVMSQPHSAVLSHARNMLYVSETGRHVVRAVHLETGE
jgi:hypothetical protein